MVLTNLIGKAWIKTKLTKTDISNIYLASCSLMVQGHRCINRWKHWQVLHFCKRFTLFRQLALKANMVTGAIDLEVAKISNSHQDNMRILAIVKNFPNWKLVLKILWLRSLKVADNLWSPQYFYVLFCLNSVRKKCQVEKEKQLVTNNVFWKLLYWVRWFNIASEFSYSLRAFSGN